MVFPFFREIFPIFFLHTEPFLYEEKKCTRERKINKNDRSLNPNFFSDCCFYLVFSFCPVLLLLQTCIIDDK